MTVVLIYIFKPRAFSACATWHAVHMGEGPSTSWLPTKSSHDGKQPHSGLAKLLKCKTLMQPISALFSIACIASSFYTFLAATAAM